MGWPAVVLYYFALGTLLLTEEQREWLRTRLAPWRRPAFALFLALAAAVAVYRAVTPERLAVHFLDVGQGDAALVVTPRGRALLIDTGGTRDGSFDIGARVDVPYLLHHGIREVEAVFLTHAHEDHAQGCGAILQKMPVGHVYTAGEGTAAYARSMGIGDADPLLQKFIRAQEGDALTIDGVKVEVLFAPPAPEGGGTGNEVSNVYRVSYGRAQFLFTGDLVKEQEAKLLETGKDVRAAVLKPATTAPRHRARWHSFRLSSRATVSSVWASRIPLATRRKRSCAAMSSRASRSCARTRQGPSSLRRTERRCG